MASERETVMIEGARLIFRNFTGSEKEFNPAGIRSFCVELDEETARDLEAREYNVKWPKPRMVDDEEEARNPYLQVAVSYKYDGLAPTIVMITSTGRAKLTEQTVETLDYAEITNADLIISPSRWSSGGKTGIKAYLKSLYVTVQEDALERKYALQAMEKDNA